MNILITNDDGIYAEGLRTLKTEMEKIGKVTVVAPDRPRSACGHSITLHKPLRVTRVHMPDDSWGYATSGTPSDCITLGVLGLMEEKPDIVIAGVNWGPNLGYDLTYSGTVSAAMEGVIQGIPSFSISVATYEETPGYDVAVKFAYKLSKEILENGLPEFTLLNVNIPDIAEHLIKGVEVTRVGTRTYPGRVEKRTDPMGRTYYWLGGDLPEDVLHEGTDVKAIVDGKISVTPIHLDLTNYTAIGEIKNWQVFKDKEV